MFGWLRESQETDFVLKYKQRKGEVWSIRLEIQLNWFSGLSSGASSCHVESLGKVFRTKPRQATLLSLVLGKTEFREDPYITKSTGINDIGWCNFTAVAVASLKRRSLDKSLWVYLSFLLCFTPNGVVLRVLCDYVLCFSVSSRGPSLDTGYVRSINASKIHREWWIATGTVECLSGPACDEAAAPYIVIGFALCSRMSPGWSLASLMRVYVGLYIHT